MIKQLEELTRIQEELGKYFEDPNFAVNYIKQNPKDFFEIIEGESIYWGLNKEESDYSAEIKNIIRKEEVVAVLVESDFGDEDYWNIFYEKNEIEFEENN